MTNTASLRFMLIAAAMTASCQAQPEGDVQTLRKEIDALKEQQKTMARDIEAIKNFLTGRRERPQFQGATLNLSGSPSLGQPAAKVTIVEYADYQCSFCARYFSTTFPQIVSEYVKTGKVKYVFRNFPLEAIHPAALKAAAAALCAGDQQKYWEMHSRLFSDLSKVGLEHMPEHGRALGLDSAKFKTCLDSGKYVDQIRKEMAEGQKLGVEGTPTYFLGVTGLDQTKLSATATLVGAQPFEAFKQAIDGLLAPAPAAKP
ncbi:MAG: DsbA family protein [Bryobacteraceae bacterium]